MSYFKKDQTQPVLTVTKVSFHKWMTYGLVVEIALIVFFSVVIVTRFNTTTLYELLVTVLALIVMGILMIRNHIAAKVSSENSLEKSIRETSDYKQALDSSAIVAITDNKGIIQYANDNFCSKSKYSKEELIGQNHRIVNSGFHSNAFFRSLWVTVSQGRIWKGEIKNRAKDGSTYWVDTTIVPFLDAQGKPYKYLSIRFDITERKLMEDSLKETEANLNTVFENTGSAYILMNNELEIVAFNSLAEQFSIDSLKREGKVGDYVVNYFPEDRREVVERNMREALAGMKIQYEVSYKKADGSEIWYEVSMFPISKNRKTNYGLIMELVDVTKRKNAEDNLSRSQANLMAIIQNTDSTIYSIDNNCRYITFNQAHHDILHRVYGLDIQPGDHVYDFLDRLEPSETKAWQEIYSKAFSGEISKFEKEFHVNDFHAIIHFTIYPIWEHGQVIGLSCFTVDVTEKKKIERQLKKMTDDLIQRNKDLEQFSYIVSHNLRGPVANILGLSNIVKCAELDKAEKDKVQSYLFQAVEKLDEIVRDLNHTVNTKQQIREVKEEIMFSEIVENVKSSVQSYLQNEEVNICTDFSAVNEICSVKSYFYNIFYNLISNSLKYAHPGRQARIFIKSEKCDGKVILRFCDNGIGIDTEQHKDKLFGLYQRFNQHKEGKGMGLFMVKTQVEALGGKVQLQSEVDRGAEFMLEFEGSGAAVVPADALFTAAVPGLVNQVSN